MAAIREFFFRLGVLEVETPVLSPAAVTDPALISLQLASARAPGLSGQYLQTSPEFCMKRLLAAYGGSWYQISRVFRDDERGRLHEPEFTLLEWYREGFDHHQLMQETAKLVLSVLPERYCREAVEYQTYGEIWQRYLGLNPLMASVDDLAQCARHQGIELDLKDDRDGWLDLLLGCCIEPHLGRGHLTFIYDYPASKSALARVRPGTPALAERFELYLEGIELANGFHELQDAEEQERRFQKDLQVRRQAGVAEVPIDSALLQALRHGLPSCAGVALGVDRLLMVALDKPSVQSVMAFSQ